MRSAAIAVALFLSALAAGCSDSHHGAHGTAAVAPVGAAETGSRQKPAAARVPETPAQVALGLPPVRSGPVPGYVLIADRDNGRILLVSPTRKRVVWRYDGLHDPDDAFFAPDHRLISTNEEYDQTIGLLSLQKHALVWSYGHPGIRGSAPGYLSNPDDAYVLAKGLVMVADIQNCRVLFINRHRQIVRELGHAGSCGHDPPASLSSPNGATPLADGGVLVTEIGGWVDRIRPDGHLLYTVRTPTTYPSDAQPLPDGNILVAGFNTPGRVDEITPTGRIVWTFAPTGYWSLDRPSLAVRWPNGKIAITDDWHHRVLVVDKRTKEVVWSYGHLDRPGTAAGYLNKPDGLDLLPAGPVQASVQRRHAVERVGALPEPLSKAAAVTFRDGELLVLGGLVNGSSTDQILAGTPSSLRVVGSLPAPTHDAAAAVVHGKALLFGGGQGTSTNTIVAVSRTGAARRAGALDEPLSDLGSVELDGRTYLVGGYTGAEYASAVLRYANGRTTTVARLPAGTRYAGVASLGGRIYVAGGLTLAGPSDAVWAIRPGAQPRRVATLPRPEAHAALVALRGALYLVGGRRILRILPAGQVSIAARLPRTLEDPAAVVRDGRIVIVGGGTSAIYAFRP